MKDAFAIAASRPWLIQREALETVLTVADRCGDPEMVRRLREEAQADGSMQALQTRVGRPLDNTRYVSMRDGVAVIAIRGVIFRYANLFTELSGGTATGILARDIQTALDNPYVHGIVLDIDSPGGDASGINELGELIRAARTKKTVKAYGAAAVASAAYWLASAADELIVDATAQVGSIGVVMSYLDTSERDKKSDVRRVEIVSSQSPDKRVDPATDEGRAKVQSTVDALADVFVNAVAINRGVSVDTVLSDFGRGGVLIGAAAVKAGMADRLGSLEAVIAEVAGRSSATTTRSSTMSQTSKAQVTVSATDDLRKALAAGYTAEQITLATADADALAKAKTEGVDEGRKASADAAIKAERARIAKIQGMAREGFEAELKTAIDEGHAPEAFAMALLEAAKDRGISIDAIRKDAPPAAAHGKPGNDGKTTPTCASASDIFAARRKAATQNAA